MKNKKIISLICALAMVFSMFSAFTVVNAAGDKGIKLEASISKDNKTITIDATAVGTTGNLNNFGVVINVPDGVTLDNVKATSSAALMDMNIADGLLYVPFLSLSGAGTAFPDGKLCQIVITLPNALTDDYVIALQSEAGIEDQEGAVDVAGGMATSEVTVTPEGLKPPTADRPSATTEPDTPDVPKPVEPTGKGIALKSSLDKTGKIVTIDATAVGTTGNLNNFGIVINVPDGVTLDNVKATSSAALMDMNIADGLLYVPFLSLSGAGTAFPDGKLCQIVITLPNALTAPYAFTLQSEAGIEDQEGAVDVAGGMTASSTVASPSEEEPKVVKTAALKDYVGNGGAAAAKAAQDAQDAGKTVYLTVDVKKADGTAAVYGSDFVAEYPAGTKLTEAAYKNLIHGYTDADMSDVITNLKYNVYNSDVKTISTTLNADGDNRQLVDPVTDKTIGASKPTPAPKKPSIGVTLKPTTAVVGTKVTVTAKVTNPKEDGVLTVATSDDSLDYVTGSGIKSTVADDNKSATTTFTGAVAKTNAVVLTYTYTYTDDKGEEQTVTAEKKITIKEKSSPGTTSDKNDNNDNTGIIAPGNDNNQGITSPFAKFTDLDSVAWAQTAINVLASRGVVSGRDGQHFDPNANITRAEYCQILIGAIEKNNDSADVVFNDVATDAWYYHAVAVASKLGIVEGYGDGNFGPNNLITRQDMALMTYKAAIAMNKNLTASRSFTFADAAQISDYAVNAVQTLANAGIINGVSDTEFAPKANATRAQAAVILYTTFVAK